MASNSHNPRLPRDPDFLLSLKLIPPHLVRIIPMDRRPAPINDRQKDAIRQILNMRKDQPFRRCRGTSAKFLREAEARGDFSHSAKNHLCPECQCKNVAGFGTKGDFYGLGSETGMYGVGFCLMCYKHHHMMPGIALRNARIEVALLQTYGEAKMDTDQAMQVANAEVDLARSAIKAREEVELVRTELARFQALLKAAEGKPDARPTRYVQGELVPMSDKDIFDAMQDVAKTLSRLNVDGLKLDASKYILVDYVMEAGAEIKQAVERALMKQEELIVAKQVRGEEIETDEPIRDYVGRLFVKDWTAIWLRIRNRIGRLGTQG